MSETTAEIGNYITLNRRFFDHHLWKEDRVYSRAEAWLDLIRSASFEDNQKRSIRGQWIEWNRGELPGSLRFFSERWKWSKDRVSRFFSMLEADFMIKIRTYNETEQRIITLCNYDTYNIVSKKTRQQTRQQRDTDKDTDKDSDKDKDNTVKKLKNVKKRESAIAQHTPEEEELFSKFQDWILKNAPTVSKMDSPFTISEYLKLRSHLDKNLTQKLLLAMHNYKPLLKKNSSAYLTITAWAKKEHHAAPEKKKSAFAEQLNEARKELV